MSIYRDFYCTGWPILWLCSVTPPTYMRTMHAVWWHGCLRRWIRGMCGIQVIFIPSPNVLIRSTLATTEKHMRRGLARRCLRALCSVCRAATACLHGVCELAVGYFFHTRARPKKTGKDSGAPRQHRSATRVLRAVRIECVITDAKKNVSWHSMLQRNMKAVFPSFPSPLLSLPKRYSMHIPSACSES